MNVAFVRILLIVVEALVSLLLIGVVLLQRSRSEGLGMAFGAGMGETLFGSRTGNVLTRITVWLSVIFVANTLVLAVLYSGGTPDKASPLMTESAPAPVPMDLPAPGTVSPEAEDPALIPDAPAPAADADPAPAAEVEPAEPREPAPAAE
jgi:preprotein translocase subunit SecG